MRTKSMSSTASAMIAMVLALIAGTEVLEGVALGQVESVPDTGAIPADLLPEARTSVPSWEAHGSGADDSLQLRLLEIDSIKLRYESDRSDVWHRLIPSVTLTASAGWKDLIMLDPASPVPAFVPRDAYRITAGLSLSGILDDAKHKESEFALMRLRALRDRLLDRIHRSSSLIRAQLEQIGHERDAILRERAILEKVDRFNELRFRDGDIKYDALAKAKLQLIELEKRLQLLDSRSVEIRSELDPSSHP